ncbi:hypothetical protein [Microbulbifer sp. 2205BS26-8]|uniref:hypothetical protein n=1 Tax=Microbulbifer sp. 2205BS26-8 TaxID=3064386 RepID=UPI00273D0DD0|nr:hypothetical protein [Microbulbifer sp. 2205BS26-8]MDP5211147.1 hypothetical protein [Microbulbifer sp. 2205BS26-8]
MKLDTQAFTTNSTKPAEDALREFERHQDAQPEETAEDAKRIERGIAEYFLEHILPKKWRDRSRLEACCESRFSEIALDEIDKSHMGDILLWASAGQEFANECALKLAKEYREELESLAVELGYIEGLPGSWRKPTEDEIENVAFFIEMYLMRESGKLSQEAALAHNLIDKHIPAFISKLAESSDSTGQGLLAARTLAGYRNEAGDLIHNAALATTRYIAEKYFWRFEKAARMKGCIAENNSLN